MNNVRTYINGKEVGEMGVIFGDKSLTALMTPPPMKPYIENESRLGHGKRVLASVCKIDARNVQLTFGLRASSLLQFMQRYQNFCNILQKGIITLTVAGFEEGTEVFRTTYNLIYLSCQQYSEFNGKLAKFVLKVCEPDPSNRSSLTPSGNPVVVLLENGKKLLLENGKSVLLENQ